MPTLHFETALTPEGWQPRVRVSIDGGRISDVTPDVSPEPGDERHRIGVPGMTNVHSHAFQRGMAGLAEVRGPAADSFWTWRDTMYRFALAMQPADVEAVAGQLYVEMLEAGFTRVGEFHYLHHTPDGKPYADLAEMSARIAAAASATGIGLTLLPVFYAHGDFGGASPKPAQRRFVSSLDLYARMLDKAAAHLRPLQGAVLGLAPHSLRAATTEEMTKLMDLVPDAVMHIHVAEQLKEVEDCIAWCGRRPVEVLLDEMGADSKWCFIHATHMTDVEIHALARAQVVAGLCPITEANLGDGIFPAEHFMADGGRISIGSDSNVEIGVGAELRLLEYGQRLVRRSRNVLARGEGSSTGRALFDAALSGGATALGQRDTGIRSGAAADLVSLDASHPSLIERRGDAILDAWIFADTSPMVDCVWSAGARVVAGGRHIGRERILPAFQAAMARLAAAL